MLSRISILVHLCLLASTSYAADLLTTLRSSNATLFADTIEANPDLSALFLSHTVRTVFAPVDSVLANIPPSRRALVIRADDQDKQKQDSFHCADKQSDESTDRSVPIEHTTSSDEVPSRRGGGKKQAIIMVDGTPKPAGEGNQRRQDSAPLLQLVTGLGKNVTVLKSGISYDGGSIYTIDGLFTVPTNLSNTLATLPDTTTFGALLNSSNLTASLDAQTGGTFFIPSNTALAANQNLSLNTLQNYIVKDFSGYLPSLSHGQTLKTANGGVLTVNITDGVYYINGSKIISSNIILENGVAYVLDKIITPTTPAPPVPFPGAGSSILWGSVRTVGVVALSAVLGTALMA
jgi:uncharacterized surface protein with fasciclin (FAS1) repeats